MAISRMQQPRQMYGLGSFVKKAVKGITGAVKSVAKSPLGLAALGIGGAGLFGMGPLSQLASSSLGTTLAGLKSSPLITGASKFFGGEKTFGKTAAMFGLGGLGAAALQAAGLDTENPNEMPRDVESLKGYLRSGYLKLNPGARPEDVDAFVEANTREYAANGGRIGYADGTSFQRKALEKKGYSDTMQNMTPKEISQLYDSVMGTFSRRFQAYGGRIGYNEGTDFQKWLEGKQKFEQGQNAEQLYKEYLEDKRRQKIAEQKTMAANGGRIGFFKGAQADARGRPPFMNPTMNTDGYGRMVNSITGELLSNFGKELPKEKSGDTPIMPIIAFTTGTNAVDDRGIDIMPSMPMYGFDNALNNKSKYDTRFGLDQNVVDYLNQSLPDISGIDFIDENFNGIDDRKEAAYGGRMQYAFGSPEENAMKASGIMGLPQRVNQAGVKELDLRDSGGFIPPVGVKEKGR
jgi:hypothetical protein